MNKLLIVLLAVCLVTVHAFVKRDAPAEGAKPENYIETIQKQLETFSKDFTQKVGDAFDPETVKKGLNDAIDNLNKATKPKGERRKSQTEPNVAQDEIKKFKENLLQSVSTGGPIISESEVDSLLANQPRSLSGSKTRENLAVPENLLAELDENKLFELKEAFLLFDLNADGCIDHDDLRGTLVSLGEKVDETMVQNMLSEASNPLDFDAFVNLLGFKTLELDSEETLVAALSCWDSDNSGYISEERIRHDLMTWGDRFTEKEADYALDEAPIIQKDHCTMIDYVKFCSQLCGLRKPNKNK